MKRGFRLELYLFLFISFSLYANATTSMNFLTKGQGDIFYCHYDGTNCYYGNVSYNNGTFNELYVNNLIELTGDSITAWTDLTEYYPLAISLPNITMQQINDSIGNWSLDRINYARLNDTSQNILANNVTANYFCNASGYCLSPNDIITDIRWNVTSLQVKTLTNIWTDVRTEES